MLTHQKIELKLSSWEIVQCVDTSLQCVDTSKIELELSSREIVQCVDTIKPMCRHLSWFGNDVLGVSAMCQH